MPNFLKASVVLYLYTNTNNKIFFDFTQNNIATTTLIKKTALEHQRKAKNQNKSHVEILLFTIFIKNYMTRSFFYRSIGSLTSIRMFLVKVET